MDLGIAGKVALVTGSSRGLGRAAADALAAEGARVVYSARRAEPLAEAVGSARALGYEVDGVPDDITDPGAAERLVTFCNERFGAVDILVSNTAGPAKGSSWEVTDRDMQGAFEGSTLSHFRLAQAVIEPMTAAGWGRICAITSHSLMQAMPSLALSTVARAAFWGWVKGAAFDLRASGVTLNVLAPGRHRTDRFSDKSGRPPADVGDPEQFGKLVAFLCSDHAAFVSGTAIAVNGGSTLAL